MSVVESPSLAAAIDCLRRRFERSSDFPSPALLPCKRKLEEFSPGGCPGDGLLFLRMRKLSTFDTTGLSVVSYDGTQEDCDRLSTSCISTSGSSTNTISGILRETADLGYGALQFFVRDFSRTIVIHALPDDTVELVHGQIRGVTGIPISEQRLIFKGRQLQLDRTLAQCGVQNDSCLQLTGRMRSTEYPGSWMVANDIVSLSSASEIISTSQTIPRTLISRNPILSRDGGHLNVFLLSGAPAALVMLYASSPEDFYMLHAERSIQHFLNINSELLPRCTHAQCFPIILEFCRLLSVAVSKKDKLYISCRRTLSSLLESTSLVEDINYIGSKRSQSIIQEIFPFVNELASTLSANLSEWLLLGLPPGEFSLLSESLGEFSNFLSPLQRVIQDRWGQLGPFPIPLRDDSGQTLHEDWFRSLHAIFMELLEGVDRCLKKIHDISSTEGEDLSEIWWTAWSVFLLLLTRLNDLSEIFQGAGEILHSVLLERRIPLNALIRRAKCRQSLWWLLKHRDVTDFESRKNLVMLMFPEGKDDFDELHEMLIDRSYILTESFEYIAHAEPGSLQSGLFMEFKNEEATGPGVLREWFCLLCREIFNKQNVLFVACPNDHRRFFPNPASIVDPLHLDYFSFCGRVIALALMHKVQVGIVFDRIFFLQLSGKHVSLDDIRDADPCLFNSCKKILEMDADLLDSDVLGLTFVREVEELGSRRIVELCPGGKDIIVNSRNRQNYVDLMIQHCFVTCISEQVDRFSQGFGDILSDSKFQKLFFRSLELEDFDRMLGGSDGTICIKDWKRHTEYKGYKASDRQICWFWKVVGGMSTDQQRTLLFFWTSVKFLPLDGFSGLGSKLYIYRSPDSLDHLPTSHTCFYRLCLPAYPSLAAMRKQLLFIAQEHVGYSFGTP
ncbi:unnamed protein product [Spirodela intermedia]|uniref:HECT-type E3 ubiquitin transferase n=1 Tax=Spirodela intermedia TaxID=51605 RepID=A0A7I8JQA6_SPIIN|nr:unnamed protein product [Spirodela intermedia]CAA6672354.1 unnamed protein product [Spirodela intermedia]